MSCIFSAAGVACSMMKLLLWLVLLSGPAHPPKVKYSLSSCYCGLFVWSFLSGPAHPHKVRYSLSNSYEREYSHFQEGVHPPESANILTEQATITALRENISHLGGCAGPERQTPYEQATITA